MKLTPSQQDIDSARRRMLETRQALEDHEKAKGYAATSEYLKLSVAFKKASKEYLQLSAIQG